MWVLTIFLSNNEVRMYEYESKEEAFEAIHKMEGTKYLTTMV